MTEFLPEPVMRLLPGFLQKLLRMEFIKYGISGVIAFICDFTVLVVATEYFGIHYLISNILGYAVGLVVSYTLNIRFVFKHRRFGDTQGQEFVYFTIIVFVGLGVSELVMFAATDGIDIPYTWSKVIATFFVFLFNYIVKKLVLFTPHDQG